MSAMFQAGWFERDSSAKDPVPSWLPTDGGDPLQSTMVAGRVRIIGVPDPVCRAMREWLTASGHTVDLEPGDAAVSGRSGDRVEVVVFGLDPASTEGLDRLERLVARYAGVPVIAFTAANETETQASAARRGAQDFFDGAPSCLRLLTTVHNALARYRLARLLLRREAAGPASTPHGQADPDRFALGPLEVSGRSLEEIEKIAIQQALRRAKGNVSRAVRELGLGRTTIYRKLKQFGIAPR